MSAAQDAAARRAADRAANAGDALFVRIPEADRHDPDRRRELRVLADETGRVTIDEVRHPLTDRLKSWAADPNVRRISRFDSRAVLANVAEIAAGRVIVTGK